jgi:hypothetical protein
MGARVEDVGAGVMGTSEMTWRAMDAAAKEERERIIGLLEQKVAALDSDDQPFLRGFVTQFVNELRDDDD